MSTATESKPEKWVASQYCDDGRWGVLTEDNGIVVSVRSQEYAMTESTARLIAAAPQLLQSLEALVEQFHAYENGWLGIDWRNRVGLPQDLKDAEAAICRAKGGQL